MNYIASTEKSLKHWLKKKVKITTATIVSFLVMGTVAFGVTETETEKIIEKNDKITESQVFNTGDKKLKLTNNGTIEITKVVEAAVRLQEDGTGQMKELINDGDIIVKNNAATSGVKLLGNSRVENNKLIDVNTKDIGYGIFAIATDKYTSDKPVIYNKGIVKVNSESVGSALRVQNKGIKEIKIKNEGVLQAGGSDSIRVVDLVGGNITFENLGTVAIDGEKGNYAIGGVPGTTVINKGIIAVPLKEGTFAISMVNGSKAENLGVIQITNKTAEELKNEGFDVKKLFKGTVTGEGLVADKNGIALDAEVDFIGDITAETINKNAPSVTIGNNTTIKGGKATANIENIKVIGKVDIKNDNSESVKLGTKTLLLDGNGKLNVVDGSTLEISESVLTKLKNEIDKNRDAIILNKGSKLILNNTFINGADITGAGDSTITTTGDTTFNGTIKEVGAITVDKGNLSLSADSKYESSSRATMTINGNVNLAIGTEKNKDGEYTQNFFNNSNGKIDATGNGSITIGTENIKGKTATVVLGAGNSFVDTLQGISGNEVYNAGDIKDGKITLSYKENIYGNDKLDAIHNQSYDVNNLLGSGADRKSNIDKIYSANIYSETVRAAYDNVKLNEDAISSLARRSEVGKWTAEGKAIYGKDEYDRKGILEDYSSKIETNGLMAGFGYGLDNNTTVGVAFSGAKQDVTTVGGNSDADLFYIGLYGNKVYGNYDFTAGLGYQFGKYESENNILGKAENKYDSNSLSGYVQGRYTADLGNGILFQPRVKFGYTHIEQDDIKDSYLGVSDAEISTFDTELGFDVVKSIQLEKAKVNVKLGTSYNKVMGDFDKEFRGIFTGATTSEGFNILGAELAENTIKFNLGMEVEHENGLFYNGGVSYEFGTNDTEAYGAGLGIGYRF